MSLIAIVRISLFATAIVAFVSCVKPDGGGASSDVGGPSDDVSISVDAGAAMEPVRDSRQVVDSVVRPSGQCDPYCHWDCFGGSPVCQGGKVWDFGFGPRSCCTTSDPWPGPGPVCSTGIPRLTCPNGCRTNASHCLGANRPIEQIDPASLSVLCAANASIDGGNQSEPDAGKIVGPHSSTFGESCGLALSPTLSLPTGVSLTKGKNCDLCLVRNEGDGQSCLAQVCTQGCAADQDCPEGSTCRCIANPDENSKAALRLFCVPNALSNEMEVFDWPKCG